jgi:hypothetical protein
MTDRKVFHDSVTPLPEQGPTAHGLMVSAAEAPDRTESMALLFSLSIPETAQQELEARVARGEPSPS